MKTYKLYFLDREGDIARVVESKFVDDAAASRWAQGLSHTYGRELWQGGRLVLCLTARGDAWTPVR